MTQQTSPELQAVLLKYAQMTGYSGASMQMYQVREVVRTLAHPDIAPLMAQYLISNSDEHVMTKNYYRNLIENMFVRHSTQDVPPKKDQIKLPYSVDTSEWDDPMDGRGTE